MTTNELTRSVKIGWSQDQHLIARRLGVDRPIMALQNLFADNEYASELDCLFYGGDFFDHLLDDVSGESWASIIRYVGWRLKQAKKHNYSVRVLKGTPSHDREQNKIWETINNLMDEPADLRYVEDLSIESHPLLGDILYIPDCWKTTGDEVWADVVEAMRVKNISKVDWIIMHGAFTFQIPPMLHSKISLLHEPERYSKICRNYCLVGHVHLKAQYKNIISIGSLDRKAFGEEEPKGALRIHTSPAGADVIFMENVFARTMLTLDVSSLEFEDTIALIEDTIAQHDPTYMSLRLLAPKHSEVHVNLKSLERRFDPVEIVFKDTEDTGKGSHLIHLEDNHKTVQVYDLSPSKMYEMTKTRIGGEMTDGIDAKLKDLFGLSNNEQHPSGTGAG